MPRKRQDSGQNEESDSDSSSEDSSDSSQSEKSLPPQTSRNARHSRSQKVKSDKRGAAEKEDGELTEEEKQKSSSVKSTKEAYNSDKDIDESEDHSQKVRPVLESDSEGEASEKSGVRSHVQSKLKMGSSVSVVKLSESKDDRAPARPKEGRDRQRQDYRGERGRDRRYDDRGRRYGDQNNRAGPEQEDRRRDSDYKYGRRDRDQPDRRRDGDDRTRDRQRDWQKDSTRDDRRRDFDDEKKDREEKKNKDDEKETEKGNKPGQDSSESGVKGAAEAGKKMDDIMSRTGGAYIPPAKLRMMQEQITDKTSAAYQRMSWEALKKSINGLINKVNISNLINIVKEVFQENIVRGRGLLARSVIQAQAASPTFTHVYAALVAVINTKFPQNGELILRRLILMFRRGYRRNDKALCLSTTRFIAHLVNQQVAHEVLALEILTLLLETPTDDSVEVAIGFLKECGQKLTEVSPRGINSIFERLRNVLHEGQLDTRVQYMVEVMFAIRKDGFKDHPAVLPDLDLVEEEEQFTHLLQLEDAVAGDEMLNIFHEDPDFQENEDKYKALKKEILDEGSSDEESGGESDESGSTDSEEEEDEKEKAEAEKQAIIDKTETNLVALRRVIYLTVQSSLDVNECAHKMLKMELKPGQEVELCNMILDCCAQLRTYEKFFGLLGQRFCQIDKKYVEPFQQIFVDQYDTIHRLETNKLRNVAKFFAHLLFTDAISWGVLSVIKLTEDDTTSASRIFLKILFQELAEYMGLLKLNERLKDPTLSPFFSGIMPRDNPKNTRFSINFFTTIGLGGLTDELRDHLKVVTKQIVQQNIEEEEEEESSSSESSDSSSDSQSSSESEPEAKKKKKSSKVSKSAEKNKEKVKKTSSDEKENRSRPGKKQVNGRPSSPQRGSKTIADRLLDMAQYGDLQNGGDKAKNRSHRSRDKEDKSLSNDREKRSQQQKSRNDGRGESKEHRDRSARSRKDSGQERGNGERKRGGDERMPVGENRKNNRERQRSSSGEERFVERNKYNNRRHSNEEIVARGSEDRRRRQEEDVRKSKTDAHSRDRVRKIETYKGKQRHDSPEVSEDDVPRRSRQVQGKAKKRHRSDDSEKETKSKTRANQKRKMSVSSSESDDSSSSPSSSSSSPSSSSSSSDEEERRKAKKAKLKEHKGEPRHGGRSREKMRVENDRARRR